MKADLDAMLDRRLETSEARNSPPDLGSRSKIVPSPLEEEMDSFYAELNGCKIKPIALSLVAPFAESFVQKSRKFPTVNNLSDPTYQDLQYPELLEVCSKQVIKLSDHGISKLRKTLEPSHRSLPFSNTELVGLELLKASKHLIQTLHCLLSL